MRAQEAIRFCCAVVVICTNGSFQAKADDWVLREVSEAMALGRPIVPVFSQDFRTSQRFTSTAGAGNTIQRRLDGHTVPCCGFRSLIPAGGRQKTIRTAQACCYLRESRFINLAGVAPLGARDIIRLNEEVPRECEARKATSARSEELAQDISEVA